jgi:Ni/Co efflux regulator RcnB
MKRILSIAAGVAVLLAGAAAPAKEHPEKHHSDQGKHKAKGHHKFDDHDREVTRTWCVEHRDRLPVGFRPEDRLAPEFEARLKVGVILDAHLRGQIYPVPSSLVRLLPPPPVSSHYIAIGGHIGLLDASRRLQDLLPIPRPPF